MCVIIFNECESLSEQQSQYKGNCSHIGHKALQIQQFNDSKFASLAYKCIQTIAITIQTSNT